MSKYYLKGKNPKDELCIGVDRARFIFAHFNEDRVQSAAEQGKTLPESRGWIKNFHFDKSYEVPGFGRSPALFAAMDAARTVAEVPDQLAAIIKEDYRAAEGQRSYTDEDIEEYSMMARSLPGVGSASWAGL